MTANKKCDVCGVNEPVGVFSSQCGPISFAYCQPCINTHAEPYGALVAYLSCAVSKGEDLAQEAGKISPGYHTIIDASLKAAGKTREEFYADVDNALEAERKDFEAQASEGNPDDELDIEIINAVEEEYGYELTDKDIELMNEELDRFEEHVKPANEGDPDFLPPQHGGCWFCCRKEPWDDMVFDTEFDTNVHLECIRKAIAADPEYGEAVVMAYLLTEPDANVAPVPPDTLPKFGDVKTIYFEASDSVAPGSLDHIETPPLLPYTLEDYEQAATPGQAVTIDGKDIRMVRIVMMYPHLKGKAAAMTVHFMGYEIPKEENA